MKDLVIEKNLFELLGEHGYDADKAARMLMVKTRRMTVFEFLARYETGGLRHRYFAGIAELCEDWCNGRLLDLVA